MRLKSGIILNDPAAIEMIKFLEDEDFIVDIEDLGGGIFQCTVSIPENKNLKVVRRGNSPDHAIIYAGNEAIRQGSLGLKDAK